MLVNPALYKDAGWEHDEGLQMRGPCGLEPERGAGQSVDAGQDARRIRRAGARQTRAINFGNPGTGSSIDLTAQKLFQAAGIKLTNIGYKGQPQALVDLMTNLMHFEIVSLALALPHIKEGTVKPLAVFTEKARSGSARRADDRGSRIRGAAYMPWYGIYVPAATPQALVDKIHDGIDKALQIPTCSASYRSPTSRASQRR